MMARGRNEDALVHLETARTFSNEELSICYGNCFTKLDSFDDAKKCLNEILIHDPDNSDAHNNIAVYLWTKVMLVKPLLLLREQFQ